MRRFLHCLLTGINVLLIICLLAGSAMVVYLATAEDAGLFGYTAAVVDWNGPVFVLSTRTPDLVEADDMILCHSSDGTVAAYTVADVTDSGFYYNNAEGILQFISFTDPHFDGKLVWQNRTMGSMAESIASDPVRRYILFGLSLLFIGCVAVLTMAGIHRRKHVHRYRREAAVNPSLCVCAGPQNTIREDLLIEEHVELVKEAPPSFEEPGAAASLPQKAESMMEAQETGEYTAQEMAENMRRELRPES